MNIIQCEQGHYYDGEKFAFCPHCKAEESETVGRPGGPVPTRPGPVSGNGGFDPTVGLPGGTPNLGGSEPKTVPLKPTPEKIGGPIIEDPPTTPLGIPGFPGTALYPDPRTSPIYPNSQSQQGFPCVGWLICVKGPHRGQDFRLHVGNNMVGRSSQNCVVLANDPRVSRDAQVHIIYEPKENKFYAISGKTKSLSYLNDSLLLNKQSIKKNDIIELGDSKLMFIPCCDDSFNWSSEY